MEDSKPRWLNTSELPFFVVLKNISSSTSSSSLLSENHLYPEVQYVFEDDDFSPTIDVLEQNKNDISVIVDFNETGDEVVEYKSLSPSWQVLNVTTQASVTPSWGNNVPSTMLFIEGTNCEVAKSEPESDSIGDLKLLVESFKVRNEQLKKILFNKEENE